MKKFLIMLTFALCFAGVLSSCQKAESDEWVFYTVNPEGSFSGNCLSICNQMKSELQAAIPYSYGMFKRDDAKAISVCDQVYESTKPGEKAHYTIILTVSKGSSNPGNVPETTLKRYVY